MAHGLAWRPVWRLALASFVLAAGTGAALRFAMYQGAPLSLVLGNIRHAHSHLMFFSWATPVLMLSAALALSRRGRKLPGASVIAGSAALLGLAAYVPFLLSGYGMLDFLGRELPLSMMVSGLNGLPWYAFAVCYLIGSWRLPRDVILRLFDGAVVMLLVSSLGAALLAQAGAGGTLTPVTMAAFVDLFLTGFADGWFGVGVLAALFLAASRDGTDGAHLLPTGAGAAAWLLAGSLAVRSLARLAQDAYGVPGLGLPIGIAGALAAAGWLWLIALLWPRLRLGLPLLGGDRQAAWLARLAVALLAVKAVFELALATAAGERWVAAQGVHVLLLHAFLLGAVSLALVAVARALFGARAFSPANWLAVAVLAMLATLVTLTGLWPTAWAGFWVLPAAAYASLGPPLIALVALLGSLFAPPRLTPADRD